MTEIIPAILTESDEELVRIVHMLERAGVKRVHLDICDGIFVPTHTIKGYEQLVRMQTDIVFDVHLMVHNPEALTAQWCGVKNADRLIMHVETVKDFSAIEGHAVACGKEVVAATNPETPILKLERAAEAVKCVQFMTVHPGRQGMPFVPEVLERVKAFHCTHPHTAIMLDGGITPKNAHVCALAGADTLVSGSYVVRSMDVAKALGELQAAVVQ
jgi:ribulose-phosphate 3-epimerase